MQFKTFGPLGDEEEDACGCWCATCCGNEGLHCQNRERGCDER